MCSRQLRMQAIAPLSGSDRSASVAGGMASHPKLVFLGHVLAARSSSAAKTGGIVTTTLRSRQEPTADFRDGTILPARSAGLCELPGCLAGLAACLHWLAGWLAGWGWWAGQPATRVGQQPPSPQILEFVVLWSNRELRAAWLVWLGWPGWLGWLVWLSCVGAGPAWPASQARQPSQQSQPSTQPAQTNQSAKPDRRALQSKTTRSEFFSATAQGVLHATLNCLFCGRKIRSSERRPATAGQTQKMGYGIHPTFVKIRALGLFEGFAGIIIHPFAIPYPALSCTINMNLCGMLMYPGFPDNPQIDQRPSKA